jgi:hypothetical protein
MSNICKPSIELFTFSSNVDLKLVEEVKDKMRLLNNYRPNKRMTEAGFDVDNVALYVRNVNLDTIAHFIEYYGFVKSIEGFSVLRIIAKYRAQYGFISIESAPLDINLLPNDIKQKILIA